MKGSTRKLLAINLLAWTFAGVLIILCSLQGSRIFTAVVMSLYLVGLVFLLGRAVKRLAPDLRAATRGQKALAVALFPASYILVHSIIPDGVVPAAFANALTGFLGTCACLLILVPALDAGRGKTQE